MVRGCLLPAWLQLHHIKGKPPVTYATSLDLLQSLTCIVIIIVVNLADGVIRVRLLALWRLRCWVVIVSLQLLQQPVAALLARMLLLLLVFISPASSKQGVRQFC
jgi:hypothetical protein